MLKKHEIKCPDCGSDMVLIRGNKKYTFANGQPRHFYGCSNYPFCSNTHSAKPDGTPVGVPVNKKVRELRREAHKIAERIWRWEVPKQRHAMYVWMSVNSRTGHIGSSLEEDLIELIAKFQAIIKSGKKWQDLLPPRTEPTLTQNENYIEA